ncbi:glycosyltransferase [Aerococcaceae bacterium WGS1372]
MRQSINKRILHIMSSHGGGISTFIHNIATEVHQFGIVFDVVTFDQCPEEFIETIQKTGGDVYQLKNPKKNGWRQFQKSLARVLKLYDYDLIHCHISGYRVIAYKLVASFYSEAEFVIHAHYYIDDNQLSVSQKFFHYLNQVINHNLSSKFVGCSRDAVQSLFGYNIDREDMIIIPNSINPDDFIFSEEREQQLRKEGRQQYNLLEDTIVVGQIGRLTPIKNHALTIQIAELAKLKKLNIKFLIAGTGELKEQLEQRIQANQLSDYVQLVGRVSPIGEFLPITDVILFPSFNEGLGTTAIESQAAGKTVVLTSSLPMELELNLNLLRRVGLNQTADKWLDELVSASINTKKTPDERLMALQRHSYTNNQAAKLYSTLIAENTTFRR